MTTTDPLQRAVAFANVFTQAALDAAHAGITPQLISVDKSRPRAAHRGHPAR
jgi:hypothetical protein